ncbi:hypothetical protein Avbf_05124 [Armadillidium vulgare]|nr:hypothetical protein Avbf_05124 [Armadillidium vulgare]
MKNEVQELMLQFQEPIEAPGEAQFDFGSISLDQFESPLGETTFQNINMDDNDDELAKKINKIVDFSSELNTPDIQIDAPEEPFHFNSGNESSPSEQPSLLNNIFEQENKTTENNSEKIVDYQDYNANSPELVIAPRENSVEIIQKDQYHNFFRDDNIMYKILGENVHDTSTKPILHTIEPSKRNNNNNVKLINDEAGNIFDFQSSFKQEAVDAMSLNVLQSDDESHNLLEDSSKYTQTLGMQDQKLLNSFLTFEDPNTEETNDVKFVNNNK